MLVFLMYNISEEHLEVPRRCIDLNLSWCFFAKVGIKYQSIYPYTIQYNIKLRNNLFKICLNVGIKQHSLTHTFFCSDKV